VICCTFWLRYPDDITFGVIIEHEHPISKRYLVFLFLGHFVLDVSEVVDTVSYLYIFRTIILFRFSFAAIAWVARGAWKKVGENWWVKIRW